MGKNEFFFVNGDKELVLGTPNGERFRMSADDTGTLSMTNERTGEAVPVGGGSGGKQLVITSNLLAGWSACVSNMTYDEIVAAVRDGSLTGVIMLGMSNGMIREWGYILTITVPSDSTQPLSFTVAPDQWLYMYPDGTFTNEPPFIG